MSMLLGKGDILLTGPVSSPFHGACVSAMWAVMVVIVSVLELIAAGCFRAFHVCLKSSVAAVGLLFVLALCSLVLHLLSMVVFYDASSLLH